MLPPRSALPIGGGSPIGTAAGCIAAANEGFLGMALLRAHMRPRLGLIPVRVAPVWVGARCTGGGVGGGAGARSGGSWPGSGGGLSLLKLGIRLGSSSVGTTVGGLVGERSGLVGGVRLLLP
jgi:hypothetical protein